MTKIGALIVTFNPDIKRLVKNITAVHPQTDLLVIVDNGSENRNEIKRVADQFSISFLNLFSNQGIASAQNQGIKYLAELKCKWMLTLDQDSVIPANLVEEFRNSKYFIDSNTGIIAAQYDDPNWTETQRSFKLETDAMATKKTMVIASGNLVRYEAWVKSGGYDEWMFIDQVDFDFCARVILSGYNIWQLNGVIMEHEVGKVIQKPVLAKILLFPKKAIFGDHSAFREYYIQRNTIVYSKRYPEFRRHRLQSLVSLIQSRRILVYSGPHIPKLLAAWKGILDGIKYNPANDKKFQEFRQRTKDES